MNENEIAQEVQCLRCGVAMEPGYSTALGLMRTSVSTRNPKLVFVVVGERTSLNPIKAFQQGLSGERGDEAYLMRGHRCPNCGVVELVASERMNWTP